MEAAADNMEMNGAWLFSSENHLQKMSSGPIWPMDHNLLTSELYCHSISCSLFAPLLYFSIDLPNILLITFISFVITTSFFVSIFWNFVLMVSPLSEEWPLELYSGVGFVSWPLARGRQRPVRQNKMRTECFPLCLRLFQEFGCPLQCIISLGRIWSP